jgi:hypothetical protein
MTITDIMDVHTAQRQMSTRILRGRLATVVAEVIPFSVITVACFDCLWFVFLASDAVCDVVVTVLKHL